ncbi:MAG: L-rhamnose mutarotase [Sphingomonadales bacterium]|nr:L-rhamnose mutarotase [Sphingomonadales bacterium]
MANEVSTDNPVEAVFGPTNQQEQTGGPRRFGSVIVLRPELEQRYRELHAAVWPGVLARLHRSNVRNYSIYVAGLAGARYLFSYFEYVGDDFAADMTAVAMDETTREWWLETDPCQERLPGTPEGEQWLALEQVFHADLASG